MVTFKLLGHNSGELSLEEMLCEGRDDGQGDVGSLVIERREKAKQYGRGMSF